MTIDENTYYRLENEYQQDILEKKWLESLPEMRESVLDLANLILKQEVDEDLFYSVFKNWWDDSTQEYNIFVLGTLEDWNSGRLDKESLDIMKYLTEIALESACMEICGCSVYSISEEGNWNITKMIRELIGEES